MVLLVFVCIVFELVFVGFVLVLSGVVMESFYWPWFVEVSVRRLACLGVVRRELFLQLGIIASEISFVNFVQCHLEITIGCVSLSC